MTKGKYKRKKERAAQKAQEREAGIAGMPKQDAGKDQQYNGRNTADKSTAQEKPTWKEAISRLIARSNFPDWAVMVFTGVLATVGVLQWQVINGQLTTMNGQLDVMRKDQRAWILVKEKTVPNIVEGAPLSVTLNITNTGKTPVLNYNGKAYIEVIQNGTDGPHFDSDKVQNTKFYSGLLFNGDSREREVLRVSLDPISTGSFPPLFLTHDEKISVDTGRSWIAVHGVIQYKDTFGTSHWIKFCFPTTGSPALYTFAPASSTTL